MLHIGLTGGIGAGKSTVAAVLAELGAVVVDADVAAREAVAAGTDGLAAVVAEFGPQVLRADGALDRPALGRIVFADDTARRRLEAIVHPRVRAATGARVAALPRDAVVVHDVPLIVENGLAPDYHLVVVVGASPEVRVRRLVRDRGMAEAEAESRIATQADDMARRAVADVWIDNEGERAAAEVLATRLWHERLFPYARNVAARTVAPRLPGTAERLVEPPRGAGTWALQAERLLTRLRRAGEPHVVSADHIGSTAVPGLPAKDVLDLQLGVESLDDADELAAMLADAGFPARPGTWVDTPKPFSPDPSRWTKRLHGNADPFRAVNLHLRQIDGPGWWFALAFRDWMRADAVARADYLAVKRACSRAATGYTAAKEPWFTQAWPRLAAWVEATGWRPGP